MKRERSNKDWYSAGTNTFMVFVVGTTLGQLNKTRGSSPTTSKGLRLKSRCLQAAQTSATWPSHVTTAETLSLQLRVVWKERIIFLRVVSRM